MSKEDYIFWKNLNRCIRCHSKDAYTMNGRARCAVCAEKEREYNRTRDKTEYLARKAKRQREKNAQRREQGLCISCGKPTQGHSLCNACLAKDRRRRESLKIDRGKMPRVLYDGVCYRCRKKPSTDGFNTCEECRANLSSYLVRARAVQQAKRRGDDCHDGSTNQIPRPCS